MNRRNDFHYMSRIRTTVMIFKHFSEELNQPFVDRGYYLKTDIK